MSKLLIIMSALDVGGAQRFCLNICKYFNSEKYDYHVLFLRKGKNEELRREFIANSVAFSELNCKSVMYSIPKIIRYANNTKPDVILSTVGNVDFAVSIAKLFIPGSLFFIRKANVVFDNQKNIANRIKLRLEAKVCDRLIALTDDMKQDYLQYGFKKEKVVVINNMVDLEYIEHRCEDQENEERWFDRNKYKLIIANARMVPEKRYDVLITAFEIVSKKIPEARLMIIGDGPLRKQIEKMIPSSLMNKVEFLGFQNNPYYYMCRASVFLLTSDYEGFPNVVIEALACGLPVVATDCKTGPREIIENAVDGWVVNRGNPEAVAMGLENVLTKTKEEWNKLSINAKSKAQRYRRENIAKKYMQLINNSLES